MKTGYIICDDSTAALGRIPRDSINLIYLDPPFFSKRSHQKTTIHGEIRSFDDNWEGGIEQYLDFMQKIISECHRVLKKNGTIYVHCDWHISHYLKIKLDSVFGYANFRNEIIWKRHNSHNDAKQGSKIFGRIHDSILYYSKGNNPTWNPIYQKYSEEYVRKAYRYLEKETGRYYAHGDIGGPGGEAKGDPYYTFLGITRHWRFSEQRMNGLYRTGKVIQTKPGNMPLLKRYLDDMKGIQLQDIWDDIKPVRSSKTESTMYPTQKPIKLLERLIHISSNEKDVVLDPFCGSGTTLEAADNLGRKWIGIDVSKTACEITKKRMEKRKETEKIMTVKT